MGLLLLHEQNKVTHALKTKKYFMERVLMVRMDQIHPLKKLNWPLGGKLQKIEEQGSCYFKAASEIKKG